MFSALITGIAIVLGILTPATAQAQASSRSGRLNNFVIEYYESLIEAAEANQAKESEVLYRTDKDGEKQFIGYISGRLDQSYAKKNTPIRRVFRGRKTASQSTALTNYSASIFRSSAMKKFPKANSADLTKNERKKEIAKNTVKQKKSPRNIMMQHSKIHKKWKQ